MPYSTLETMLAAALRQASQEDRLDVAEYIIRALELLDRPNWPIGERKLKLTRGETA